MATLDDSPSLYLGQQWTYWAEKVEAKSKNEHTTSKEERCSKDDGDTIKLRHQDMPLYGLCPARDEFYLVVCECCEQVIKPQALKRHIEQRHGLTSPRVSGTRKSKGSPGRHSGSPARHINSPARHVSPKRDSHGKNSGNPSPVKSSSKSTGSSSHRSGASNTKSKKANLSQPVVKVERMLPSAISSNSSSSTKISTTKHDHRDNKHDKEHRDHSKESHREHKHEKEHKESHREKDYQEHHKEHRDNSRDYKDHKDKDHKHDKEHPKEKEHLKEKEHIKEKERRDHTKDRDHRERERERKDRDRTYSKEKDHRTKDHERQEKERREKEKADAEQKEKEHREKEKEQKEKERKEKEQKEREKDRREKEQKEKDRREKEQREKELKEKERKDKELKEIERKEKERKEKELKEKEHREKELKEKEKERKEKERKERDQHKEHRDKKSTSNNNSTLSSSVSQTTSSVTPPRSSSSHKLAASTPSPSTMSNSMASPSERSGKQKFVKEKLLPCKDREFDANKHCGVWIPEIARQCTRSLTCKTHALSLRRAVQGRRKPFDELLKEHRAAKEAFLKAKAEEKEAAAIVKAGGTPNISTATAGSKTPVSVSGLGGQPSSKTESGTTASSIKIPGSTTPTSKSSKQPVKITSPIPSRPPLPPPPAPREEVGIDSCSRLSSDDDEDNDERDRLGYPLLSHQPRPAAVNSFGARRYSGSSCIVFNRKADFLRAAFHACVERHLHPPPYKKLCVESKLPQSPHMTTNSHDPYDFPTVDLSALATNGIGSPPDLFSLSSSHNSSLKSSWNSNKMSKVKPKSSALASPTSAASRNIRPKDLGTTKMTSSGLTSPMMLDGTLLSPITPITPTLTPVTPITPINRTGALMASSVSLANNSTVGVKRKRSGSGTPVAGVTMHQLQPGLTVNHGAQGGNPISISIPSASLNLTQAQIINSLNETLLKVSGAGGNIASNQQLGTNKNHLNLKDVNIVMTSHSEAGSMMNGQFLTTTMPTSAIADMASLQLNSLSGDITQSTISAQSHSHKKRVKLSHGLSAINSTGHGQDGVGANVPTITSLPSGMMVMPDLTGQQTTFSHSFGSPGLLTANADFSSSKLSPSTTSPLFSTGSVSPQTPGSSPMANGMFGHGLELKVNHGLPVNHVTGAMMVSPGSVSSTPNPQLIENTHSRSSKALRVGSLSRKSSGSRSKSHSRTQQLAPQVAASQQLTATAITLTTPGNRLLSTALPTMYTMDSGKFQHIQIQPKVSTKQQTLATGKLSMQPMLTIPMTTVTSPQQPPHLLLQNDDHQLSGVHHAVTAQQLQNSPSNVLS